VKPPLWHRSPKISDEPGSIQIEASRPLGVVFGDIGTGPLCTPKTLASLAGGHRAQSNAFIENAFCPRVIPISEQITGIVRNYRKTL